MNKYQMLDAILVLLDKLVETQGIEKCALAVEVAKRLEALKKGLKAEESSTLERIDLLKKQLKEANTPHPRDGEIVEGGQTYTIDMEPKVAPAEEAAPRTTEGV